MKKIKICLAGASGNVGRELIKGISADPDIEFTAAVGKSSVGKKIGDITISDSVSEAAKVSTFDVLIDYTTPEVVYKNVMEAIEAGVHCVIGTSGLSDVQYQEISKLAKINKVGVSAAGNFSLTATLLQHFATITAQHIPHWEIIDYAPDTKPDAPSGTTRELAFQLSRVGKPGYAVDPKDVQGLKESRGATLNNSQVHSVRVPGFYSSAEVIFGLAGERLSLRHDSHSHEPYVQGTLMAVKKVISQIGLTRGLAEILGLSKKE